jgi:hypothetical protein
VNILCVSCLLRWNGTIVSSRLLEAQAFHCGRDVHEAERVAHLEQRQARYLHWLGQALGESECALHAYAMMTNHVHLLLTPKKAAAVPRLIISLGRRYVQYINRS